jgi:hypothetical protein
MVKGVEGVINGRRQTVGINPDHVVLVESAGSLAIVYLSSGASLSFTGKPAEDLVNQLIFGLNNPDTRGFSV